ncbi:MAG: oligosaccharide flippase family protein [Haliscomenobacter sp.]|nr:oligosaccharide flippase family protein [Haliscomenobacter sp.]MBK9487665.1 oligosaccharide flippase family protein [Haliscomenobacter sp.]
MSLLKKLAGETAIYGMSSILPRLLNFVMLTPFLTRILSRADYGIFSDLYAYVALFNILLTYRMETAYFRYAQKQEDAERAFSTSALFLLLSTFIFTGIALFLAQPIADLQQYPAHPEFIVALILILALDTLTAIPFARLRFANRPLRFMGIKLTNVVINVLLVFFYLHFCPILEQKAAWEWLQYLHFKDNMVGDVFLANVVGSAVNFLQVIPSYLRMKLQIDWVLLRQMLRYSFPLIIAGVAGVINQLIGAPLLKFLGAGDLNNNLENVGVYSAAIKIPVMMNLFTQAFNYAAEPFFFRNANEKGSERVYGQVAQAFTLVSCVAFLGIMLNLDWVGLFLGQDFREGLDTVPVLLLANLFLGLFTTFSIWYKLVDRTAVGGWIALGGSLITIVLNVVLIKQGFGYYAPAWTSLVCYLFMTIASYWAGQKFYPIKYPLGRMALYLVLAVLAYLLSEGVRYWAKGSLPVILSINFVVLLAYFAAIAWIEKPLVRRLFARKK